MRLDSRCLKFQQIILWKTFCSSWHRSSPISTRVSYNSYIYIYINIYVYIGWFAASVPSVLLSQHPPSSNCYPSINQCFGFVCFFLPSPLFCTIQALNVNFAGQKWVESTGSESHQWCNYHWVTTDGYTCKNKKLIPLCQMMPRMSRDSQQLCLVASEWETKLINKTDRIYNDINTM